ncbi:MAG: threonylcarbamoyl-AMP synthase [Ruminococcaceae bacterium]|nr:threonylcarbamoyl-AMP synthase [Oscillospiraceae bacterium]
MKTELIDQNDITEMSKAGEMIREGKLVAFPTETVYGLGCNALDPFAAKKIYEAKGRPSDNPLIVHLADPYDAEKYCHTTEMYYKLADAFMPGPLTVVLKKKDIIPDEITAGKDTVAIRVPSCRAARELIALSERPIAAPSANISGKPSPTAAKHVIDDLYGKIDAIVVGDDSDIGLESTIVFPDDSGVTILRPGGITYEQLAAVCGCVSLSKAVTEKFESSSGPVAPGMKYKHYAPREKVYIVDSDDGKFYSFLKDKENCGVLCFEEDLPYIGQMCKLSFGSRYDQNTQAHKLFSVLRSFDSREDIDIIYARMPSKEGIGLAVFNRLIKAAGFDIISI